MNPLVFNVCILLGWVLVLAGGCMLSVPLAFIASGLLMLVLVLVVARAAGVFAPRRAKGDD